MHHGSYYYYLPKKKKNGTLASEGNNGKSEKNSESTPVDEVDERNQGGLEVIEEKQTGDEETED